MEAWKEGKFLVFKRDDDKILKYNLATKESIGILGKPVKSIAPQLRGYNVYDVISSFPDENYKRFLRFVLRHFVNASAVCSTREVNKVSNVGTFLSKINDYLFFEQYFAAGIKVSDKNMCCKLSDIPKQLFRLCRLYDLELSNDMITLYNDNPDLFSNVMSVECISLTCEDKYNILKGSSGYYTRYRYFNDLIKTYNYNATSLIKYIDNLVTYEALEYSDTLIELQDYCRMMNTISPKFEKYPKNFLTTHKIATRNYNRLKERFNEELFKTKIKESLEWQYDKFKIIYPKTTQDIKDEAVQQSNCVASYIQNVLDNKCDIVFLRTKDFLDQSLVTMEVRNNKVVQCKGRSNRECTKEELEVIEKYNKHLERIANKTTQINNTEVTT